MVKGTKGKHSRTFQAKVALAALAGGRTLAELAQQFAGAMGLWMADCVCQEQLLLLLTSRLEGYIDEFSALRFVAFLCADQTALRSATMPASLPVPSGPGYTVS